MLSNQIVFVKSNEFYAKRKELTIFSQYYAYYRAYPWSSKDKLTTVFKDLLQEPNLELEFIDDGIIRAYATKYDKFLVKCIFVKPVDIYRIILE